MSPTQPQPQPQIGMISMMSPDPRRLGTFWSELMGLPIAEGASEDLVMLNLDHDAGPLTWILERRENVAVGVAPIALDIGSQDEQTWREVADHAERLGAERVAEHEQDGVRWIEMRDPDSNRFRVFAPRPAAAE